MDLEVVMVSEPVPLGELISTLYEQFLAMYGDEELASIATASAVNEILEQRKYLAEREQHGFAQILE